MTVRLHCHSFTCINFIRDEFLWFLNKTLNFTTFFVTDHTILRGFLHFCYHYSAFLKTMKIYIKYISTNIKDISTLKLQTTTNCYSYKWPRAYLYSLFVQVFLVTLQYLLP